ncbi:hypothetical protein XHV734_4105 [Xanthomonas hortorum pv. vitians]|nr:hypothetical protein XHV734_4105 [Xanthomonas hortorum pv. vitians]
MQCIGVGLAGEKFNRAFNLGTSRVCA